MANIIKSNLPFQVDDLEQLLQRRNDHSTINTEITRLVPQDQPRLQSKTGATLPDFIRMVSEIVAKATKERNVVFEPDEGARPIVDQDLSLNEPHIFYEVLSRVPCMELKPRERQEILDTDDKGKSRKGRVWGQRFECHVQFNIVAGDYETADKVMEVFEDLMFNYTSYFKRNGVAEILFEGQHTDHNMDIYRQSLSIRSLQYCVWVEKLHAAFDTEEIDGIITE
jgi:hypothetical protein